LPPGNRHRRSGSAVHRIGYSVDLDVLGGEAGGGGGGVGEWFRFFLL